MKKKKVLVIVAHPDDETIWMGGTLLSNKDKWDIAILSLCRRYDEDRAPKFRNVCRVFKAKCFMSDLEDEKLNDIPLSDVTKRIKKFFGDYDYIFTHGENGEYGHKRHIDTHNAVVRLLEEKSLSCEQVFFFSYIKRKKFCYASQDSDKFINLDETTFKKKQQLINDIYGFAKKSFESVCSRDKESFDIRRLK